MFRRLTIRSQVPESPVELAQASIVNCAGSTAVGSDAVLVMRIASLVPLKFSAPPIGPLIWFVAFMPIDVPSTLLDDESWTVWVPEGSPFKCQTPTYPFDQTAVGFCPAGAVALP